MEVEADRDQAQAEQERELQAPVVRVRQEVCGKAARAEDRAAQVPEAGRVEVARVAEEEQVQVQAELDSAEAEPVLAQVPALVEAGALLAQELEEVELDRAERERQEDG